MTRFRRLVVGLSLLQPGFDPRSVHVRLMGEHSKARAVCPRVRLSIIPPVLYSCIHSVMFMLHLAARQTQKAYEPSKKQMLSMSPSFGSLRGERWFETDVSEVPVGFHFQGPSCQASWPAWPLNKGPIGRPETSVTNHLARRKNPEDGRIQFTRCGSLPSRKPTLFRAPGRVE